MSLRDALAEALREVGDFHRSRTVIADAILAHPAVTAAINDLVEQRVRERLNTPPYRHQPRAPETEPAVSVTPVRGSSDGTTTGSASGALRSPAPARASSGQEKWPSRGGRHQEPTGPPRQSRRGKGKGMTTQTEAPDLRKLLDAATPARWWVPVVTDLGAVAAARNDADAALIVALRNAAPYLLDVVGAAQAYDRADNLLGAPLNRVALLDALQRLDAHLRGER